MAVNTARSSTAAAPLNGPGRPRSTKKASRPPAPRATRIETVVLLARSVPAWAPKATALSAPPRVALAATERNRDTAQQLRIAPPQDVEPGAQRKQEECHQSQDRGKRQAVGGVACLLYTSPSPRDGLL